MAFEVQEHVEAAGAPERTSDRRWVARAAVVELWRRLRDGWREVPRAAKRRWGASLLVGFVLCAMLTFGLTRLAQAWAPVWLNAWDRRVLVWIEHNTITFQNAVLAESFGNLAYMIPLTGFAAAVAIWRGHAVVGLSLVISYVVQRPLVVLGWLVWDRARPDLIAGGIASPPLHSYPSGHVALMMSVYGLLAYLWCRKTRSWSERAAAVLLLVLLVGVAGLARLRLGTHWPSDVIAGVVVGSAWLLAVIVALRTCENHAAPRPERE